MSQNLRKFVDMVAELSFYTVTTRLARLLREIPQDQLSESGSQRLTQDDLAARIGTVREVVACSLKELEKCGAIEVNRGKITIVDKDQLIDWEGTYDFRKIGIRELND
jgi:CRP/FNR family transcriptional regulator